MRSLLLGVIFLFSSPLWGQKDLYKFDKKTNSVVPNFAGIVILKKGNVSLTSANGKKRSLKLKDKIYGQDQVTTARRSMVKIEFTDKSVVSIGPKSVFKLDDYRYKAKDDRKLLFKLIKGQLRSKFKVKAKGPDDLRIRAGHVSMAVRGSTILTNLYYSQLNEEVSQWSTLEGLGQIRNEHNLDRHKLQDGETYISILGEGNNIRTSKKGKLTNRELQFYLAPNTDPDKYFRPLLKPNFTIWPSLKGVQSSSLEEGIDYPQKTSNGSSRAGRRSNKPSASKNAKSWKKTLKNLNQKLQQNNRP